MTGTFISRTGPISEGMGKKIEGNLNFWPFPTERRQLFWPVFWPCMVPRWCPMPFVGARWSLGGPGLSLGVAGELPGGYRVSK